MSNKTDITSRADIELLVDRFYKKVLADKKIGQFFTEVVQLNWDKHMPIMYDFWETTLLGNIKYKGNPMLKHIELAQQRPLEAEHFAQWLELWRTTIKELFDGDKALEAITRAENIASLMQFKIQSQSDKT